MRRLVIVRHAKAEPNAETDFLRPLSRRGHQQARECAKWIRKLPFEIDVALVSSALRTAQTWEELNLGCPVNLLDDAYNASAETLVHLIREFAGTSQTVLIVGHNPGISDLAFANGYPTELSTCASVLIELTTDWNQFGLIEGSPAATFNPDH